MTDEPNPISKRQFSPGLDWLESGWIIETSASASGAAETESFVIGGGAFESHDFDDLERFECAVWAPDFFPNEIKPFSSAWSCRISRIALLKWLSENFPGSTTSSKVHWTAPLKVSFEAAFKRIQTAFREDGVKKAVPAIFSTGWTASSDRRSWLAHRLRAGLEGTMSNSLRLYGLWAEGGGFLGATPETLFTHQGSKLTSMAVAGTRTAPSLGDVAIEALIAEFERDPKELSEHRLVVRDIASIFDAVAVRFTQSKTRVEKFGALFHLVTDFEATVDIATSAGRVRSIADWVRAFHPTPALGTSPRDSTFRLLYETHALGGDGVERENFGAPFIVKYGDRVDAIVAIRQIRWKNAEDDDRIRLTVGSGCGVVPESELEREWSELQGKRGAVMRLFRLSPEESRPVFRSLEILEKLIVAGVRRFVVCAGARNAPLVVALETLRRASTENSKTDLSHELIVESFFEERAAGFYALGLSRSLGEPVAVVTTSGTAVAELLPAMAEADLSGVPLIAVTADRPRRLRHSGAPQSIPQDQIFAAFVARAWDLEDGDSFDGLGDVERLRPLHVNVCLEEPLLDDAQRAPEALGVAARRILADVSSSRASRITLNSMSADHSFSMAALAAKLSQPRLIAIVGGLAADEREAVAIFLRAHAIPCLLEAPSGLRGDPRLADIELKSGDLYLQNLCVKGEVQHVLRLGGVPTTRVWRDLDEVSLQTQTLSISKLRYSGLGRGQFIHLPAFGEFASFLTEATSVRARRLAEPAREWIDRDRATFEKLETLLGRYSNSEPGFVRLLSEIIPRGAMVYVGNSLPIRWWDLAATRSTSRSVEVNRGVNGIDGQISTAFGLAAGLSSTDLWILVGDLTALYDLSAPWALANGALSKIKIKIRIVIMNNSGGRIFKRVLAKSPGGSAPFENEHSLDFKNWAAMWNLDYARVTSHTDLRAAANLSDHTVIEIAPSADDTAKFWEELT